MSSNTRERVGTTRLNDTVLGDFQFVELIIVIIVGWVLVALWQRFIENLMYHTFGLNEDSSLHTFVVAAAFTAIFIGFIILSDQLLQKELTGNFASLGSIDAGGPGSAV